MKTDCDRADQERAREREEEMMDLRDLKVFFSREAKHKANIHAEIVQALQMQMKLTMQALFLFSFLELELNLLTYLRVSQLTRFIVM